MGSRPDAEAFGEGAAIESGDAVVGEALDGDDLGAFEDVRLDLDAGECEGVGGVAAGGAPVVAAADVGIGHVVGVAAVDAASEVASEHDADVEVVVVVAAADVVAAVVGGVVVVAVAIVAAAVGDVAQQAQGWSTVPKRRVLEGPFPCYLY